MQVKGSWRGREGIPEQGNSLCKGTEATEYSGFWEKKHLIQLGCRVKRHNEIKKNGEVSRIRIVPC